MKDIKQDKKKTTNLLIRVMLTFTAIIISLVTELLIWLGFGRIKTYYLWHGDMLDALILGFCILFASAVLVGTICVCLYFAFKDTRIGNFFNIKLLKKSSEEN